MQVCDDVEGAFGLFSRCVSQGYVMKPPLGLATLAGAS